MTSALARIGHAIKGLRGWPAWLAAVAAGAVSALGFAPFDLFPLLLLGLAALVLLLDGAPEQPRPIRHAAIIGWCFGFGQFAAGMHWIFFPFLVDPVEHAWQIPFVAILFPGGLALFIAAAAASAAAVWRPGISRIFALAAAYATAEWLRGHVLTGFPWNLPGYGWEASLGVLQSAALFGVYGLSLLTVLFGFALAELFVRPQRLVMPAAMAAVFAVLWLGGAVRLNATPTAFVDHVRLRLVQPDVPQELKYVRALVPKNWATLIDLSERPSSVAPTVIIWPEAAPPVLLQRAPDALDQIAVLTNRDKVLITGNQRFSVDANGARHFFNSLYVFGHGGELRVTYDKFHLVPFGEYLPLEPLLGAMGISKLVGIPGSFSSGDGPHTIAVPGAPDAGPLICYEILFPGAVTAAPRPHWLVNVTDDSWFGPWAGPRQHFLAARVRAIEEGLPVARAANTGISAVIDPDGRVVRSLGLNQTGIVDAGLPLALSATPYALYGDLGFAMMLILVAALSWLASRR